MDIRFTLKVEGELLKLRDLKAFIDQLPPEALDDHIMLHVDGGCAEAADADFRNGMLNLY